MKSKIINFLTNLTYYPRLLLDWIISLTIKNDLSLLETFHGQDCLIVGNGPSLNQTPLDKIKMPSIGMNKINLLFDKTSWRPDLIVCVNGLVIRQNRGFFNSTLIPLVLPIKALYLGIKRRPHVIFIRISDSIDFQDNIKKPSGIGSTVTFTCMQIAAFARVKTVNIVGVDHSFNYKGTDGIKMHEGDDPNHFDPNYFKNCLWGLPDLEGSERAYLIAKKYFDNKGVRIIDYTIKGKLSVFDKGDINQILK